MKIETILNAFELSAGRLNAIEAKFGSDIIGNPAYWRRDRQYRAFRARILREFAILRNFAEVNGFDPDQKWFWTDQWQAKEREVDEFINQGDVQSFDTMERFLEALEANND